MKQTIIGIAGGTASGKTTIAANLYESARKLGSVALIKIDDYYYGKSRVPMDDYGNPNYDHPDAYDVDLIIKNLNDLLNGKAIEKPVYDFVNHCRSEITEIINPSDVIIIEGIMVFAIKRLRKYFDIKVFVDTPDDIRFIRRLKRDMVDRGRTLDSVVNQYLNTVRPMHEAFVEPSKKFADIIIPDGGHNEVAMDFLNIRVAHLIAQNHH